MTTRAERLPEEVLFLIFEDFDTFELFDLQFVCPAWYFAAHVTLLRENISLYESSQIQRFIRSIDSNPHPSYLAAIKEIMITSDNDEEYTLTPEELRKVFFRFPNLKKVTVEEGMCLFKEMTDELCQEFLTSCPKLEKFKPDPRQSNLEVPQFYDHLYNVRPLVTLLDIDYPFKKTRFKTNVMDYITGFPRLKKLKVDTKSLNTFGKFLTALERLPNLEKLVMYDVQDDQEYFAEKFLATKTKETQNRLVKQLSQFKLLGWRRESGTCLHTIKFIQKYFTGLKRFEMFSKLDDNWEALDQRIFCQTVMDIVCSIQVYMVTLQMDFEIMSDYLPLILHKVFYNPATISGHPRSRYLRLRLSDEVMVNEDTAYLEINKHFRREAVIRVNTAADLEQVVTELFTEDLPREYVDNFELIIKRRHDNRVVANTSVYCKMLVGMKSLKSVHIDVPASFKEISQPHTTNTEKYPLVKDVTIHATSRARFQTLLHQFSLVFSNIEHLSIRYFCGDWKRWIGEFQLLLPLFSLTSLTIDVTPVLVNMKKLFSKQDIDKEDYFVIQLELLSNSKLYLYKVFAQSLKPTRISHKDVEGLQRGKDYLRIHVTIMSLERLLLQRNTNNMLAKDEDENYVLSDSDYSGIWGKIVLEEDTAMETSA